MELQDLNVEMNVKRVGSRPDGLLDNLPNHFRVHLHRNGLYRRFYYSMGEAWGNQEPEILDVLNCLLEEYFPSGSFSEFCSEFGYDEDWGTAQKVFREIQKNNKKMDDLFGDLDIIDLSNQVREWSEKL